MRFLVKFNYFTAFILFFTLCTACAPARPPVPQGSIPKPKPITVSEEQYGHQILTGLTKRWELDYNHPKFANVTTIVKKLTKAAHADQDPWHVYVLKDDSVKNAAATRGNHVFIWTGMLNTTQGDGELAAIMAHEIAHVLARHTDPDPNEELKRMLVEVGAAAAGIAVAYGTKSPTWSRPAAELTTGLTRGVGSGLLVKPYTRTKEKEADEIGFFLMADAGYNPEAAIDFWKRANNDPAFQTSVAFLSDHPPASERLANLQSLLPRAMARYRGEKEPPALSLNKPKVTNDARASKMPLAKKPVLVSRPAGSSATTLSPGDSFDMRQSGGSVLTEKKTDKRVWRVQQKSAPLHSSPSVDSKIIRQLEGGAAIEGTSTQGPWVKTSGQEQGYVYRPLLEELR